MFYSAEMFRISSLETASQETLRELLRAGAILDMPGRNHRWRIRDMMRGGRGGDGSEPGGRWVWLGQQKGGSRFEGPPPSGPAPGRAGAEGENEGTQAPPLQTTAPAPACSLRMAAMWVSGPGLAPAGRGLCQNPPCARLPLSRRPSVWVPSGQSCPPPSCALCFWLMHQPDSLKQNHLLSRQDPLFLSWHQMELLRRQRSFLSPEGVEMAPQATYVHTSLVGFRDEVNRASPLKTAQMTRGDAGAHLTESSAKYS
uniref:Uncharacterized protein n=1 Tax=Rangifer tarandus platyrhynchus TaxID=3082113 RepID=A0ACB0E4M9_RANTA|nr:unnamed protein product [Rangifer tarandus platyrhynchus]